MLLLYILGCVRCLLPLEEPVMIVSADEPEYEIVIEGNLALLKGTEIMHHRLGDPNLLEIYLEDGGYRLKFLKYSLYAKEGTTGITGESFVEADPGFIFDFVSTRNGMEIRVGGRCLTKTEMNIDRGGYILRVDQCDNSIEQKFLIRRAPLEIEDNHTLRVEIRDHDMSQITKTDDHAKHV